MKNYTLLFLIFIMLSVNSFGQTNFIDLETDYECGTIYTYQKYPKEESQIVLHIKVSDTDALFLEAQEVEEKTYFFSTEEKICSDYTARLMGLNISFDTNKEKFYFQLGKDEDEKIYQIVKKSTMHYNGEYLQYASRDLAFQLNYKTGNFEDLSPANAKSTVAFDSFIEKDCYHNIQLNVRSKNATHPPRTLVLNTELGIISLEEKYNSTLKSGLVKELTSVDFYNYHDFLELKCKFYPNSNKTELPKLVNSKPSTVSASKDLESPNGKESTNNPLDPFVNPLAVKPLDINSTPDEYGIFPPSNFGDHVIVYDLDRKLYINKYTGQKANGYFGGILYLDGQSAEDQSESLPNGGVVLASRGDKDKVVPKNETDCLEVSSLRTHVVQNGETIISISRLYDIDVRSLKEWNGMKNSIDLYPCMRLDLYPPKSANQNENTRKIECTESPTYNTHIVQPNENIVSIANFYGLTTQQLKNWNGLRTNYLTPCSRLLIQRPTDYNIIMPTPPVVHQETLEIRNARNVSNNSNDNIPREYDIQMTDKSPTFHIVRKGETLYRISKNYGISLEDLVNWNNLESTTIKPGEELRIKE